MTQKAGLKITSKLRALAFWRMRFYKPVRGHCVCSTGWVQRLEPLSHLMTGRKQDGGSLCSGAPGVSSGPAGLGLAGGQPYTLVLLENINLKDYTPYSPHDSR